MIEGRRRTGALAALLAIEAGLQRQRFARGHGHRQGGEVEREVDRQPARQQRAGDVDIVGLELDHGAVERLAQALDDHFALQHVEVESALFAEQEAAGAPGAGLGPDGDRQQARHFAQRQEYALRVLVGVDRIGQQVPPKPHFEQHSVGLGWQGGRRAGRRDDRRRQHQQGERQQ